MKQFLDKFGQWLRHKIRVVIIKQWKIPKRIYINLQRLNKLQNFSFTEEDIFKVANSRLGWYRRCGMNVVNYILNPRILAIKKKERQGLVNPLEYYLSYSWQQYICSAVYEIRTYGAMGGAKCIFPLPYCKEDGGIMKKRRATDSFVNGIGIRRI